MSKIIETDELIKRLNKRMDKLPQRDLIEKSDADQWIGFVANVMPEEAMWHMIRAGGVGGSEIGGLVRNYLGYRADFGFSAHNWVKSKLLKETPMPSISVMQRGHFMEPHHAQLFYEQFNARRDEEAFEKLTRAQGQRIWMRYSPDDVFMFDKPVSISTADGVVELHGRVLGDYKAPTNVDMDARIAFEYSCQLHQGAILCQEQGIKIEGALLSQFDWATFSMKNDFVEIDPNLCELIYETGDHYWNCVMKAEIPDYVVRDRVNLSSADLAPWQEAASQLGLLNAIRTNVNRMSDELRSKILEGIGLDKLRFDGAKIEFPNAISITAPAQIDENRIREALGEDKITDLLVKNTSTQYDTAALVRRLKELGEDVKPYRKMTRLDPSLTFNALQEAGLDPEEYIVESARITVDRSVSAAARGWCEQSFPEPKMPLVENESDAMLQEASTIVNSGSIDAVSPKA